MIIVTNKMTPTSEKIGNKRISSDRFGYLTIKFESIQENHINQHIMCRKSGMNYYK